MPSSLTDLRSLGSLGELPSAIMEKLASGAILMHYSDRQRLFNQGEPLPGAFMVLRGTLKVLRSDDQGHIQVFQWLHPGDFVGEVQVLDSGNVTVTAEAYGETDCWLIPTGFLRRVIFENPEVAMLLLQRLAGKVRHLVDLVDSLSLHSVPERVARLLLERHHEDPKRLLVEFQENQEDLAHRIGSSREAFSRALRTLSNLGLIQSTFPVVHIVDLAKLGKYVQG